jgi:hypothetical protein
MTEPSINAKTTGILPPSLTLGPVYGLDQRPDLLLRNTVVIRAPEHVLRELLKAQAEVAASRIASELTGYDNLVIPEGMVQVVITPEMRQNAVFTGERLSNLHFPKDR